MLKTRFINPAYPQGEALAILESLRYSYRYLQSLLIPSADPEARYAKLLEVLNSEIVAQSQTDPCHQQKLDRCSESTDFHQWGYTVTLRESESLLSWNRARGCNYRLKATYLNPL